MMPLDVTGTYNSTFDAFDYDNLTFIIANITDPTYTAARRLELSFKPTLYPLYEEFMTKLRFSKSIIPNSVVPYLEHTKIDRFFWGSQLNPQGNVVNDHLDAIEIKDLKIKIQNINC
jgi:hypothetical protein